MKSMIIYTLLALGFITLGIIWFSTDPRPVHERLRHYSGFGGQKTFLIQISHSLLQVIGHIYLPVYAGVFNNLVVAIGLIGFVAGLTLAVWAKFTMKRVWGVPAQHDIKRQNKLITNGPFRFTRNPIYVGLIMMSVGFAFSLRSMLFFTVYAVYWYFNNAVKREELLLEKHFGKEYETYKKQTPRFL